MENRKGMMKTFLYENLRELMTKNVFEKITIKQICDRTGVIRATFYNYFEDKYDCLNQIVYHDLCEEALANPTMLTEQVMENILTRIDENRDFYRAAYNVTGQNSFESMVHDNFKILFLDYLNHYRKPGYLEKYDNEYLAGFFAASAAYNVRCFVFQKPRDATIQAARMRMIDMLRNSLTDFTRRQE
jgi:AcrR family transcriptional regulator